ncbi:hypothetical protein D3C84_1145790 [compost metagenome]
MIGQIGAKQRPEQAGCTEYGTEQSAHAAALLRREHVEHNGEGDRNKRAAPDPLNRPVDAELDDIMRRAAKDRS